MELQTLFIHFIFKKAVLLYRRQKQADTRTSGLWLPTLAFTTTFYMEYGENIKLRFFVNEPTSLAVTCPLLPIFFSYFFFFFPYFLLTFSFLLNSSHMKRTQYEERKKREKVESHRKNCLEKGETWEVGSSQVIFWILNKERFVIHDSFIVRT